MKYRCCNDVIAAFSALNGLFWNWLFRNRPASSPRHSWPVRGLRGGAAALVSPAPPWHPRPGTAAPAARGAASAAEGRPRSTRRTPPGTSQPGPAPRPFLPSLPLRSYPAPAPLPPPVPGPARPAPRCQRACAGRGRHGSHSPASGRAGTPGWALPSRAAPVLCPHAAGVQSSAPQWFVIVFRRDEGKAFIHSLLWDPFRFR